MTAEPGHALARRPAQTTCPSCGGGDTTPFFTIEGIPIHSCLLMHSRAQATELPKRDLELAHCARCGFVYNRLFDPAVLAYSEQYEETQGYSPTFNRFLEELARRVVDRYDLHGRTVLEIGCGKGEFLLLLCRLGPNRGVGIDASYVPGRLPLRPTDDVRFVRDFYSEAHADVGADFICCRHTLEHVHDTGALLRRIVRTLDGRRRVPVWFELPDVQRILDEGAFWDVYYEHCSYFSAGSLARLYRSVGLGLVELQREYDDQYVTIGGRLDADPAVRFDLEDDLEVVARGVDHFARTARERIDGWRRWIRAAAARGGRPVVWGAGSKGVAFLTTIHLGDEVPAAVDVNPHKRGKYMPGTGHPVVGPGDLADLRPTHVIAMNPIYVGEIARQLRDVGVDAEVLAVTDRPQEPG